MGCCLSTAADRNKPNPNLSKSPPHSVPEEATDVVVKEVLSETPVPITKPAILERDVGDGNDDHDSRAIVKQAPPSSAEIHQHIAQVLSEICSFSGGSPDGGLHRISRSPAKSPQLLLSPGKPDRVLGKASPTRRISDKSPARKNRQAPGRREAAPAARVGLRSERQSMNRSGRRSRSPTLGRNEGGASRSNSMGRSPSVRKSSESPGRVRGDPPENAGEGKRGKSWGNNINRSSSSKESLENPVVSLECFIFL